MTKSNPQNPFLIVEAPILHGLGLIYWSYNSSRNPNIIFEALYYMV